MTEEDVHAGRKQSLRQRYDITEQQLEFSYVNKCEDAKTLEKIIKILRSNEEGYFPDLQKAAEERLRKINPSSRLLVDEDSVRLFSQLPKEEQELLSRTFLNWQTANNESPVEERKISCVHKEYPAVRNSDKMLIDQKEEKPPVSKKPLKSCVPRDYESWQKFDVDKELSLLDREDELKQNEFVRANNETKIYTNESIEESYVGERGAGDACMKEYAIKEKTKGNGYFNEKDFENALKCYNKSLQIAPLPEVFNNRAQVYLKMDKYDLALEDCNKVLEIKPDAKAYYRKSFALEKLNRLQEAQESIEKALMISPNDKAVQDLASKIREKLNVHPSTKKFRMVIQEDEPRKSRPFIEEISSRDIYYPFNNSADNIQLNDIGTARFMCRCNGNVPPFIAKLRSVEDQPHSNRLYLRKTRSKKMSSEKSLASRRSKKMMEVLNGEIIEKDTIEAGEKNTYRNEAAAINTPLSNLEYCLNSRDLEGIAKELSTLHASQLSKELSARLDSSTLNLCVMALCGHLKPLTQWKSIQEHLVALAHLPKFRSAVKGLDRNSKKALSATIAVAEEEGQRVADVLTLYELNGAMPPPS